MLLRVLVLCCCPMAGFLAMGQQPFYFTHTIPLRDLIVADLAWTPTGAALIVLNADTSVTRPFRAMLYKADQSGGVTHERVLANNLSSVGPAALLHGPDERLHAIGTYVSDTDQTVGVFHYGLSTEGTINDSVLTPIPIARNASMDNATFFNDEIVVAASISFMEPYPAQYQHTFIGRLGLDGEAIDHNTMGWDGMHMQITRDIKPLGDKLLVSAEQWPSTPGLYQLYTSDLQLDSYWLGQAPYYNPANPFDSILKGALSILPLENEQYFVGGQFHIGAPKYHAAVYRADVTGTVHSFLVTDSPYPFDLVATQACLSRIDEETFYFLSLENATLGGSRPPATPSGPNRLHVYKLDTALNVLCDHILDGYSSDVYYFPTRIKTTPDGGFVIMGAKKDMSTPGNPLVAWAQSFAASDCTVGISTTEAANKVILFPNPGSSGFQVLLNGNGLPGGRIDLFDAQGQRVGQSRLAGPTGRMDCTNLPNGIYLYRIMDRDGMPHATGRWVKQQ